MYIHVYIAVTVHTRYDQGRGMYLAERLHGGVSYLWLGLWSLFSYRLDIGTSTTRVYYRPLVSSRIRKRQLLLQP